MARRTSGWYLGLWVAVGCAAPGLAVPASAVSAPPATLCVTEGALEDAGGGHLRVGVPKMRAYLSGVEADAAELRFVYLGPTAATQPLASGAMRVQFGLKLRAMDACNLLYVMWRAVPQSRLVVSVKLNPGRHSSAECGNQGYVDLKPEVSGSLPKLLGGESHRLSAAVRGGEVQVLADGRIVWQGRLNASAAGLEGPAGVRSDNASLEFALTVTGRPEPPTDSAGRCRRRPAGED